MHVLVNEILKPVKVKNRDTVWFRECCYTVLLVRRTSLTIVVKQTRENRTLSFRSHIRLLSLLKCTTSHKIIHQGSYCVTFNLSSVAFSLCITNQPTSEKNPLRFTGTTESMSSLILDGWGQLFPSVWVCITKVPRLPSILARTGHLMFTPLNKMCSVVSSTFWRWGHRERVGYS